MKFLLGLAMGGFFVYCYTLGDKVELREALITDMNLRTDLINWIVTEGSKLDPTEFWPAFSEKATFINIVAVRENP